jgi:hypothetical protein
MAKSALTKLHRLRQKEEVWECSARRMRAWITPRNQDPYRPYIVMTVSQAGQVVGTDITETLPSPDHVLNVLAKAMSSPALGSGRKRRPTVIYIDDESLVKALEPRLEEIGIRCGYRRTLRDLEQALLSLEQHMTHREPITGLLKSSGVTPYLVNGLFEAAATFYCQAPWHWIDDSHPIEVRYPPDGRPRYAVVMGHGGQTYGLAAYNSPEDLRELYAGTPPEEASVQQEWTSLLFVEMTEMPFDDLDDMGKFGWPVAGALAYPFPVRATRSGQVTRPGKSELLWFEAALLAIPSFLRDHMQAAIDVGVARPAEATLLVAMADGEYSVYLRYPIPGFEVPSEQDWAAIEGEEALAEAAREHNAELLRGFERWLANKGLSKKTTQRHLDDVTAFANTYMAADGGGMALPRPADQADTVDVDEFLTEWLLREAAWVSERTIRANIASLERFYAYLREVGQIESKEADLILELLHMNRDFYVQVAREHEGQES